jgi:glutathione S-transferase
MQLFNCAQRAHYNFLEHYPTFLAGVLLAGFKYPVTSAVLGVAWLGSRVAYAVGYTSGMPGGKGRYAGGLGMVYNLSEIGFLVLVAKSGYDMIMA